MSHSAVLVAIEPTDDIDAAVTYQMAPFDENGEMFGDGTRWDWWQIGGRYSGRLHGKDVIARGDIDLTRMRADQVARFTNAYKEMLSTTDCRDKKFIFGVDETETLEQYLARKIECDFPWFYGFLRNRIWQDKERLGWFAMATATECEIGGKEAHICTHDNTDGSRIVSWGSSSSWDKMFYTRFVEPLSPETLLVCVDYHV